MVLNRASNAHICFRAIIFGPQTRIKDKIASSVLAAIERSVDALILVPPLRVRSVAHIGVRELGVLLQTDLNGGCPCTPDAPQGHQAEEGEKSQSAHKGEGRSEGPEDLS